MFDCFFWWKFESDVPLPHINTHPFYSNGQTIDDGQYGEIITQNDATDSLVKHLVMDDDELSKHSGDATAAHYRKILLHNINDL
jgi:hypothetical protein